MAAAHFIFTFREIASTSDDSYLNEFLMSSTQHDVLVNLLASLYDEKNLYVAKDTGRGWGRGNVLFPITPESFPRDDLVTAIIESGIFDLFRSTAYAGSDITYITSNL